MKKFMVLCIASALGIIGIQAQVANNTSLVGTVTDPTGSVLVGAHVTAVNRDTKVSFDAVTNQQGDYTITGQLNPGTYDITVTMSGFEKSAQTGVIAVLNQSTRTDFPMRLGAETAEVTVSANSPVIQTDDSLLGETVTERQVQDLPMNGRNALDLANTASNVTVSTGSALTGVPPGKTASGAGTRGVNNSITLDGISIMNNLGSTSTVQPNPDTLTAVQTQNGNYTAQYGDYLGVHINEATKSGTNELHGTAYDYIQNDALNSRGFNRNTKIPAKAELRYNLFGFVLGGPVFIPHLYNGHNKTFFLASYEGLRTHSTTPAYTQALTQAELSGDFTALLTPTLTGSNSPILLYSPFDGHSYYNPATGKQIIDDRPAANAAIMNNIFKYAAIANVTAPGTPLTGNYYAAPPSITNENSSVDRIDQNIGDNIRLFGRFDWQDVNGVTIARELVNNNYNPTWARNGAAGFTYTITPNLVNDLRGGFNWLKTDSLDYFYENGPADVDAQLGLPAPFGIGKQNNDPGLPDFTGATSFSVNETGDNWIQDDRTYQLYDQVSWSHGKHTIMAGADIRRLNIGRAAVNASRGTFAFSSSYTTNWTNAPLLCPPPSTSCTTGSSDASLYLGIVSSDSTPLFQVKEEVTQWRNGFFVQDTWRVSKQLTVEYGLRYELPMVPVSANGFARLMDPTYTYLIPPSAATSPTGYTPVVGLPLTGPNHKDIAPRLGFAYRLNDRVTVRGGGGIYYNSNHLNAYTLTSSNFPFASSVVYPSPLVGKATPSNPYNTVSNPTAGAGAFPIAGTPGTYVTAYSVANPLPSETMYQWNLDNGFQLWRNAGLEFQYLGSHSIHLDTNLYPNSPTPGVGDQTKSVNARRPNQNFGRVRAAANIANASYNGLTIVLRQRESHGFSGNLSYTWAHALDESADANASGTCMIQFNCKADWGNSNSDIRHKAVFSFTYGLPTFAKNNFLVQEAIGGWHLNGIVTVQTGTPFNVSFGGTDWANVDVPQSSGAPQRPNYVHAPRYTCSKQSLFQEIYGANTVSCVDATAYVAPAHYTYGNVHRNDLHGPGAWTNNLSLFKDFKIHERTSFQFRLEAFNAFNHANLTTPTNITFNVNTTTGALTPATSSSAFGAPAIATGSSGANPTGPRVIQVAGKINF